MIGNKIKELRIARGWTTRAFAEHLGITYAMVHRYESGQSMPRPRTQERIAKIFGITLAELNNTEPIKLSSVKFDAKSFEQALVDCRQLDEETKTIINLLINEFLEKKKLKEYKSKIEQMSQS